MRDAFLRGSYAFHLLLVLAELFETESKSLFDDLCAASVASPSDPAIHLLNEGFWNADGYCTGSLSHSRPNLPSLFGQGFELFDSSPNRIGNERCQARVATLFCNDLPDLVRQTLRNCRADPPSRCVFLPTHVVSIRYQSVTIPQPQAIYKVVVTQW